jgi:hypothetical protein
MTVVNGALYLFGGESYKPYCPRPPSHALRAPPGKQQGRAPALALRPPSGGGLPQGHRLGGQCRPTAVPSCRYKYWNDVWRYDPPVGGEEELAVTAARRCVRMPFAGPPIRHAAWC